MFEELTAIPITIVLLPLFVLGIASSMGVTLTLKAGFRHWYGLPASLLAAWLSWLIYRWMRRTFTKEARGGSLAEVVRGRRLWLTSAVAVWAVGLMFGSFFAEAMKIWLEG